MECLAGCENSFTRQNFFPMSCNVGFQMKASEMHQKCMVPAVNNSSKKQKQYRTKMVHVTNREKFFIIFW